MSSVWKLSGVTRRLAHVAVLAGAVSVMLVSTSMGTAQAVAGYTTTGQVNVRYVPAYTNQNVYGTLPAGKAIDIACQISGQSYNGTAIWDRVVGWGFITDFYVAQTPYARFDPRIPRCSSDVGFTDSGVDMQQACRYTYNNPTLVAYSPPWALNSPFGWACYSYTISFPPSTTAVGGVDVQKYCTVTRGGSRAVIVAWQPSGWRCRY